ncbi:hypothetical protein FZW96_18250 [Bacillus sp. BGMRC 2118]|nr:hypothetical protein FZW96_18250 [Bacillus sp. BGMRC 2118]
MSQIFIYIIILGFPLFVPLYQKKWRWFATVVIGYLTYILWGVYLYLTGDVTEYGTGYGMFILPFIVMISALGIIIQKKN